MRLVSWNLAHQCREDPIPPSFFEAVALLAPDVLSLNEYVHGESRVPLEERLRTIGLPNLLISERLNGNNQVLVASRFPLIRGGLVGPTTNNKAGESNFLHVVLPSENLDFVGLRAPSYSGSQQSEYWRSLAVLVRSTAHRRAVFMGDLNTNIDRPRHPPAKHLRQLSAEGWRIPNPDGEWSFISKKGIGTRIDHAIVSPALTVAEARYVAKSGPLTFAAPNRVCAVSDHAPLLLRLGAA